MCVYSVVQPSPTLYNPMDCSLPGSSVLGISQAKIQERVAISYSRGSSQLMTIYYLFQALTKVMREEAEIDDFMEVKPPALSHRIASTQKNWLGPHQVYSIKWHSRIFKPPKSGDFVSEGFLVWFKFQKFQSHNVWLWFDLSLRLAILGLCVEVALFQWFEEKPKGRTVTDAGVRPICNFPPPAVIVKWRLISRPYCGWMRILHSRRDYLFSLQGYNYVQCCPPKYLQAPRVCQLSFYCYSKVNTTFFREHQLRDCYVSQASGDEWVCWV